jgi:hypothetical protein
MKHLMSALCVRVLIDQLTNNLTLVDVITQLYAPLTPDSEGAMAIALDFATLWSRDDDAVPGKGRARLTLHRPNGDPLGTSVIYDVDLSELQYVRNVTKFAAFPFSGLGTHHLIVERETTEDQWQREAAWPVQILTAEHLKLPA